MVSPTRGERSREMDNLSLLPYPRSIDAADGRYTLKPNQRVVLAGDPPQALLGSGRRLQAALAEHAQVAWELSAAGSPTLRDPAEEIGAVLYVRPGPVAHEQGYELTITPAGIVIEGPTPAGVFYGVCTLVQIIQQYGRDLPALRITDWPDFPVRGLMLDISRDKVPRMETLYELIDMLAGWKVNQFQLYTEHTFAYRRHPEVWANASPVTGDEILALDAFCRERYIELVPNQNAFGHMHRWLIHDRYASMAETHDEFATPWGTTMQGPFSLCPSDPGSLELVRGLFDELLPHFSSKQFNVGCDETFDLGQGRSKEECKRLGAERVYLDYLQKVYQEVQARQHKMQFWGDIIVQAPELIPEVPRDSVALEWGYEANHPFDEHCRQFAASGIPFYVCPGTSSWTSIAGRTGNALGNLLSAAENGLKHGAAGYLNTD
jgi:hexosaminidase